MILVYLDMVMKIILESKEPITLRQIVEKNDRLNYDRVRTALTKASAKGFIIQKMVRANGLRDRNIWFITNKGKDFVNREVTSIIF